jgi:hypothetical protein
MNPRTPCRHGSEIRCYHKRFRVKPSLVVAGCRSGHIPQCLRHRSGIEDGPRTSVRLGLGNIQDDFVMPQQWPKEK